MSSDGSAPLDVRAFAEAVADVLTERGLVGARLAGEGRILDAAEVSLLLGRDRRWVYEHASELGAFRYGDGPRARLGFDLSAIERWRRGRQTSPDRRRSRNGTSAASARGRGAKLIEFDP